MAEPANGRLAASPGGPRVLVVDDTDEVRVLIRRALAGHGYQVDAAASLAQASALDPAGYDVVLVDAHLGAELGTDLIDALVAQDPAAAGRCLMITGGSSGVVPHGVAVLAVAAVTGNGSPPPQPAVARPAGAEPAVAQAAVVQAALARPGGQASRIPPAWRLLGMIRGLRSSERATVADFMPASKSARL